LTTALRIMPALTPGVSVSSGKQITTRALRLDDPILRLIVEEPDAAPHALKDCPPSS